MTESAAIEIIDLELSFDGRKIIDGFHLRMNRGEKVILAGRSGSGKTSILRVLLGFTVPDRGEVLIEGERVTGASIWRLRTRMAYVAQEPVLGEGKVADVLARPFSFRANGHLEHNLGTVRELFARLLLPEQLMDKEFRLLSGGEKQRVALISAILLERRILLLDEASSALDPESKTAVSDYLRTRGDLTILSVSHDREGFGFADRVIELPSLGWEEN